MDAEVSTGCEYTRTNGFLAGAPTVYMRISVPPCTSPIPDCVYSSLRLCVTPVLRLICEWLQDGSGRQAQRSTVAPNSFTGRLAVACSSLRCSSNRRSEMQVHVATASCKRHSLCVMLLWQRRSCASCARRWPAMRQQLTEQQQQRWKQVQAVRQGATLAHRSGSVQAGRCVRITLC